MGPSAEPDLEHHRLGQRDAGQVAKQGVVLLDLLEDPLEIHPGARVTPVLLEQL
jgi:hypothetical protein